MPTPDQFRILGIVLNITGTLIVTYRAMGIQQAVTAVAVYHEENIKQLMANNRVMVNYHNSPALILKAQRKPLLLIGFGCVILGAISQGCAVLLH